MLKLKRGYLVAFEGIDGTGKSTHCRWLEEELICRGIPVERLREPTDGIWGKKIRRRTWFVLRQLLLRTNSF